MGKLKREILRKRKNKYKKRALAKWRPIVQKYDLRVGDDFLHYPSDQYGWAKAEGGFLGFIANFFFGNPLQTILAVATIAISIISIGTATPIMKVVYYATISATAVNHIVTTYQSQKIYLSALKEWAAAAGAYATKNIKQAEIDRGAQSEAVTKDIIYGGYAIYPNGSIYKDQFASVDGGFSSQIAPDAAKGQYGTYRIEKMDEQINNRDQLTMGGNDGYTAATLQNEFPMAKAINTSGGDYLAQTKEMYMARSLKTITGFNKLVEAEFGLNTYDGYLNDAYKEIEAATIKPFQSKLTTDDFLYKNMAYNRAELRDFDTLIMSDFNEFKANNLKEITAQTSDQYAAYKAKQDDPNLSLEQKADFYCENVEYIFSLILNGNFYKILEITDETAENYYEIFKADSVIGRQGAVVALAAVDEIFNDFVAEFDGNFTAFKEWCEMILNKKHGYKATGKDENGEYIWSDQNDLIYATFLNYAYFCFFDSETLAILTPFFENGIPKADGITDEMAAAYFSGVGDDENE